MMIVYLFFFSSRRRHTRCGRDWSSDVCSSDLEVRGEPDRTSYPAWQGLAGSVRTGEPALHELSEELGAVFSEGVEALTSRSEERRVGKEGRSRRAAKKSKKKVR